MYSPSSVKLSAIFISSTRCRYCGSSAPNPPNAATKAIQHTELQKGSYSPASMCSQAWCRLHKSEMAEMFGVNPPCYQVSIKMNAPFHHEETTHGIHFAQRHNNDDTLTHRLGLPQLPFKPITIKGQSPRITLSQRRRYIKHIRSSDPRDRCSLEDRSVRLDRQNLDCRYKLLASMWRRDMRREPVLRDRVPFW